MFVVELVDLGVCGVIVVEFVGDVEFVFVCGYFGMGVYKIVLLL